MKFIKFLPTKGLLAAITGGVVFAYLFQLVIYAAIQEYEPVWEGVCSSTYEEPEEDSSSGLTFECNDEKLRVSLKTALVYFRNKAEEDVSINCKKGSGTILKSIKWTCQFNDSEPVGL